MYSIELQTIFYEYQNRNSKDQYQFCELGPLAPPPPPLGLTNLVLLLNFYYDIRGKFFYDTMR